MQKMDIEQEVRKLRAEGYTEGELAIEPLWYVIWEPDHIAEYNKDYEVDKYAPGFVAFGSNGGNELLVTNDSGAIFMLPAIGMEPDCAEEIAENFDCLKQHMAQGI